MKLLLDSIAEYLNIPTTIIITVSVSLLLFFLGWLINFQINRIKRKSHRSLIRLNHKLLAMEVFRQSIYFRKFSEQLVMDSAEPYGFSYRIIPSLSVFREFGYENMFRAYFGGIERIIVGNRGGKLKAFHSLWKHFEYVTHTHQKSIQRADDFINKNAELNEARNKVVGEAQTLIEDFRLKFHGQLGSNEPLGIFFQQREHIINHHRHTKNFTLPHHTNAYVIKIINLNRENFELNRKYNSELQSVKLNALINESQLRFQNMANHLDANRENFQYLSDEYFKAYKSLLASYRALNPLRRSYAKLVTTYISNYIKSNYNSLSYVTLK